MPELKLTPYNELQGQQYLQEQRIILKKDDFKNIQHQEGKITYFIFRSNFTKLIIENNDEIDFPDISIYFLDCVIGDIQINTIVSKNISVLFGSSVLAGKINDCPLQSVDFSNCIIRGGFFLLNLDKVSVNYTEENIDPRRWHNLYQRAGFASLAEMLITKQSYYIYDCSGIKINSNWKADSPEGFYIRQYEANKERRLGYRLTKMEKEMINLNFSLKFDLDKEYRETKLEGLALNALSISGSKGIRLSAENSTVANWYLHEFLPKEDATFYGISAPAHRRADSKLEIHKCNLDKTWFDNIRFNTYSRVSFYRTKFSKTVFTSCSFPKDSIDFETFTTLPNIHYEEKKEKNFYKDKYEIFLQLKMALEATGNFHEAQKLFSIANEALRKLEDVPRQDKFILWINRNSNNHGLSVSRPFGWLLGLSVFFYLLYLLSIGRIFNGNEFDPSLIGYYFSFLDLTHRSDFLVEKTKFGDWTLFLDYLNKVVVGFFIYQFIAAFRKYGKK